MAFAADVDHLVPTSRQVLYQVVGPHDVGTGGVHGVEPHLGGPFLDLRRHAVGREDDGAAADLFEAREPARGVDQPNALLLELVGDVGIVDELTKHVHGAVRGLTDALGDPERVHHAVAVASRRYPYDLHPHEPTTRMRLLAWPGGVTGRESRDR